MRNIIRCLVLAATFFVFDAYSYCQEENIPAVTSFYPLTGSVDGGTEVLIHGANLDTVNAVYFGENAAVITEKTDNIIRLFTSQGQAGVVPLRFTYGVNGGVATVHRFTYLLNNTSGKFKLAGYRLADNFKDIQAGDLDNDEDVDVVTTSGIYINDGQGYFTKGDVWKVTLLFPNIEPQLNTKPSQINKINFNIKPNIKRVPTEEKEKIDFDSAGLSEIGLGDVDRDFDLDIIINYYSDYISPTEIEIYLNDGKGVFYEDVHHTKPDTTFYPDDIIFADVDNDSDQDIIFSDYSGQNKLWLNDGNGNFIDATNSNFPIAKTYSNDIDVSDVDNDGDLDILFDSSMQLYINNGNGKFSDESLGRMPIFTGGMDANRAKFADIDSDGYLDIVAGFYNNVEEVDAYVLFNDGKGFYKNTVSLTTGQDYFSTYTILTFDIDGDSNKDIVLAQDIMPGYVKIYKNNGDRSFYQIAELNPEDHFIVGVAADIDSDADTDIVGSHIFNGCVLLNDGGGNFENKSNDMVPSIFGRMRSVSAGDLDGDMDIDILISSGDIMGGEEFLLTNNENTSFIDESFRIIDQPDNFFPYLDTADIDGDNDLDYVLGMNTSQSILEIYKNQSGQFSLIQSFYWYQGSTDKYLNPAFGDVNNDGRQDIIVGVNGKQSRLLINDGTGYFLDKTEEWMPVSSAYFSKVICEDFSGDYQADLIIKERNSIVFYINRGSYFEDITNSAMPEYPSNWYPTDITASDFDLDGDLDIAVSEFYGEHRILINNFNKDESFFDYTNSALPNGLADGMGIISDDVDGDEDMDILIGQRDIGTTRYTTLLINDGDVHFSLADEEKFSKENLAYDAKPVLLDFDNDGDLDIFLTNYHGWPQLLIQE